MISRLTYLIDCTITSCLGQKPKYINVFNLYIDLGVIMVLISSHRQFPFTLYIDHGVSTYGGMHIHNY